MKLVVGLGNPGKKYENTRHNVGFDFINSLANGNKFKLKFNGEYIKLNIHNEDVILLKPLSYMNLSGKVVKDYINYFKISIDDILIISDDLDMNIGKIKTKYSGSSGGHNGLKDIEKYIGTKDYKRFKIGIANDKTVNTADYVLGHFNQEDQKKLNDVYSHSYDIINDYICLTFDNFMTKYNKK